MVLDLHFDGFKVADVFYIVLFSSGVWNVIIKRLIQLGIMSEILFFPVTGEYIAGPSLILCGNSF